MWWVIIMFGLAVAWQLTHMVDRAIPGHPILQALGGIVAFVVVLGGLVVGRFAL